MEILRTTDWISNYNFQFHARIMDNNADEVLHKHLFYEIFYIIEGNITHIFNGKQKELQKGDAVIIRYKDNHMFLRKNKQFCCHRDIIIGDQLFANACNFLDSNLLDLLNRQSDPPETKFFDSQILEFENTLNEISCLSEEKNFQLKKSQVNALLANLLVGFIKKEDTQTGLQPWMKTLMQNFYVVNYLKEGLPRILKNIPYNQSYVCRTFKQYTGVTMSQFLLEKRLEHASILLQTSNKTISTICEEIGIESIPYFTKQFNLKYHLTPSQFRAKKPTDL